MPVTFEEANPDTLYLRSPLGGPVGKEVAPSADEIIKAGFRLQNAPYNIALALHETTNKPEAGYNPNADEAIPRDILENYGDRFTFSMSKGDSANTVTRINEENKARETLDAGGWLGTGAQIAAGMLDPTIFIPGGTIYRGARGGVSLARTALSTGLAAGGQAALQEAALQGTQETRRSSESVLNVGTATLLGAILGTGAGALLGKSERDALQSQLGNLRADLSTVGDRSAGAAMAGRDLSLTPILPPALTKPLKRGAAAVGDLVSKVPVVGKPIAKVGEFIAGLPEWLSTKTGPSLRIMSADMPGANAARHGYVELAEIPLRTEANVAGLPTSERIPLEREIRTALRQAEFHLTQVAEDAFRKFRFGSTDVKFAKIKAALSSRFGGSQEMTFDKFMEEVDWSLRHNDGHDIPEVAAVAKQFREVINAPYEKAVKLELLNEGTPLGADSYAPRKIVRDKLIANKPQFVDNYLTWRRGDQATKANLQERISQEWDALRGYRIAGKKAEGRLATAEKRITELESRLSERGMEAKATLGRAMTLSERNAEAKATTQEIRDFITELKGQSDSAPIRDQIRQMESELRQIEEGSQLINEKDLEAIDKAERQGILTGNMRRVARVLTGKAKPPKPPSFWKWIASQGGVKSGFVNADAASAPGLSRLDGPSLDAIQEKLAGEFPELRARGYGYVEGRPAGSFADEISSAIQESIAGREPDWFLAEKWSEDDRFVSEWSQMVDQAAHDAGVEFKNANDVADFLHGESSGMTEADYKAIIDNVESGSAAPTVRAEGEALGEKIAIRQGSIDLFKDALAKAKKNLVSRETGGKVAGDKAGEAKLAERRNFGRLGILNERARIGESQRAFLDDMRNRMAEQEQAARNKIEGLISQWEGNTAKGAQSALERRAGAESARATSQFAKGAPNKNARLQSADAPVEKAVRDILKSDHQKTDTELADEAEQTFNQYIGTPDGRLPKDDPTFGSLRAPSEMQGRGPLIARRNPMPDDLLRPFLDKNPLRYTMHYLRSMMSDIGMFERFGDFEGTSVTKAIDNEASLAARNATTETERLKIYQGRDKLIADFAAVRDRQKGIYGFSPDTVLRKAGEVSQALGDFDVMTNMGMSGLAQIPDFANIVARYAFSGALAPALKSFLGHLTRTSDTFKMAKSEYGAIVGATEMFTNSRGHELADMGDIYQPATKFARILRTGAEATMTLSGNAILTDWEKTVASIAASTNILKAAKAAAAGTISKKQVTMLSEANISEGMASKIWQAFDAENGGHVTKEGAYLTNTANWADAEARQRFEAAVGRDVDIAVAMPGEEKPLFLSTPTLALIGKYKSFVAAANTRILLANLQRRDASTLSGMIAAIGLGMVVSSIRSDLSGIDTSNRRPQDWIKEGIDRSGWLGWLGEANAMSAQATRGSLDLYRLVGADRPLSRYSSRSILGSLTGPIGGKIESLSQITGAASSGEWSAGDVRKLRQLIPFQNLFYIRNLVDQVEAGARDTFGISQRAH